MKSVGSSWMISAGNPAAMSPTTGRRMNLERAASRARSLLNISPSPVISQLRLTLWVSEIRFSASIDGLALGLLNQSDTLP